MDRWPASAQARRYARVTAIAFARWLADQTPPATSHDGHPRPIAGTGSTYANTPGVKPITVAKNVSELRALFAALSDTIHERPSRRDYGPMRYVAMPKFPTNARTYVATPTDVDALLATFDHRGLGRRDATMIVLMFYSGLRFCEIVRANLEDVDLDTRTIHLPVTKSLRARTPRISDETMPLLRDYLRRRGNGPGPLFVNVGPRRQSRPDAGRLRPERRQAGRRQSRHRPDCPRTRCAAGSPSTTKPTADRTPT